MRAFPILWLLCLLYSCGEKKETKETMAEVETELIYSGEISELLATIDSYQNYKTLVLDQKINCDQLNELCKSKMAQNLNYVIFQDFSCNELPTSFLNLVNLETLILSSNELDHMPQELLALPKLKKLQFQTMDYETYQGAIPPTCVIEEIEFQTTPVEDFGTLEEINTLKKIGIVGDLEEKIQNEDIEMVNH